MAPLQGCHYITPIIVRWSTASCVESAFKEACGSMELRSALSRTLFPHPSARPRRSVGVSASPLRRPAAWSPGPITSKGSPAASDYIGNRSYVAAADVNAASLPRPRPGDQDKRASPAADAGMGYVWVIKFAAKKTRTADRYDGGFAAIAPIRGIGCLRRCLRGRR